MIKIKNKLFARKKRQPTNENLRGLYNIFRNRVNRTKNNSTSCALMEIRESKGKY